MPRSSAVTAFVVASLMLLVAHAQAKPVAPQSVTVVNSPGGNGHALDVTIGRSTDDGVGANDVTRYKVERKKGKAGVYARIKKIMADGSTQYDFTDTGLVTGGLYYYRVTCTNESEWSDPTVGRGIPVDNDPPGTPGIDAVDKPDDQGGVIVVTIRASADDATGADDVTRYNVYRRTAAGSYSFRLKIAAQDKTSYAFQDTNLVNGRLYYYQVKAYDGRQYSATAEDSATAKDNRGPRPPRNPRAKDVPNDHGTALVVRWDRSGDDGAKADDVSNYRIYRKRVGGTFSRIARITAVGALAYEMVDNGLVPGETYNYRIRAYDGTRESDPVDAQGTPLDNLAPGAPQNLSVADRPNDQGGALVLTWDRSADDGAGAGDVKRYEIYREADAVTSAFATVASVDATGATSYGYTDAGLTPAQKYNYEVRAFDGSKLSAAAQGSGTPLDDRPPSPPTNVMVVDVASDNGGAVSVSFTASRTDGNGADDVVEYEVERKKGDDSYTALRTIPATDSISYSFADTGLTDGVTYTYRVQATDGSNYSDAATGSGASEDNTPPGPPTNLAVVVTPDAMGSVDITFDASPDDVAGHREVKKYEIFRRTSSGSWKPDPAIKIAATALPNYSFTNTGLKVGVEYRYRVLARGDTGVSTFTATVSVTPTDTRKPAAPRNLTAADRSDDDGEAINLAWNASPDDGAGYKNVGEYWVYRKFTGVPEASKRVKRVTATQSASYETTDTNDLQNLRAYTYTVVAVSTTGVKSDPSNEAEGIPRDNLVLAAPTNLVARDKDGDSGGVIEIYWTRSTSEAGGGGPPPPPFGTSGDDGAAATVDEYELFRRPLGGSWPDTPLKSVSTDQSGDPLLTEDTGLQNGRTYEYKVRYRAGTAISPFSNSDTAAALADGASSSGGGATENGLTVRIVDAPAEAPAGEAFSVVVSVQGSGLSSVRLLYTDADGEWLATEGVDGSGSYETIFTVTPDGGSATTLRAVASNETGDAFSAERTVALVD